MPALLHLHPAEIIRWVDADTVILRVHVDYRHIGEPLYHRLTWIQAPERYTERGKIATARVNELAPPGTMVTVQTFWLDGYPDSFGRWLANIFIGPDNNISISELLLREGLAVPYHKGI